MAANIFKASLGEVSLTNDLLMEGVNSYFGDMTVDEILDGYTPDPEQVKIWQAEIAQQELLYPREIYAVPPGEDEVVTTLAPATVEQKKAAIVTEAVFSEKAGFDTSIGSNSVESQVSRLAFSKAIIDEHSPDGFEEYGGPVAQLAANWAGKQSDPVAKAKIYTKCKTAFEVFSQQKLTCILLSKLRAYLGAETKTQQYMNLYAVVCVTLNFDKMFRDACRIVSLVRNFDPGWWIALCYHNQGGLTEWCVHDEPWTFTTLDPYENFGWNRKFSTTIIVEASKAGAGDQPRDWLTRQYAQMRTLVSCNGPTLRWENFTFAVPFEDSNGLLRVALLLRNVHAVPCKEWKTIYMKRVLAVDIVHDAIYVLFGGYPKQDHPKLAEHRLSQSCLLKRIPKWGPDQIGKRAKNLCLLDEDTSAG